jgi:dihydroxyacid dehydratase/phosphogluconate dehydratase
MLDVAPVGAGLMDDLARAGGVPAVLAALAAPVGEPVRWPLVASSRPVTSRPAFMVVRGNLAPDGAVIKAAAASPSLLRHRGPAVVFHSYEEMRARIDERGGRAAVPAAGRRHGRSSAGRRVGL